MESDTYDVIVVGLSCAGLSVCYHAAKKGLKVVGLEANEVSGDMGSSSYGTTRIFRKYHKNLLHTKMMEETYELWKEWETNFKTQLLYPGPVLYYGDISNKTLKSTIDQHSSPKILNHTEIMSKYPAFENLPAHYVGIEVE